tara:strand:- start:65 stop:277 length:213 start_codon:yes stop_codon:yes gene_type:complete
MTSPAQREANKRYRQKNYEKIKAINNKSNRKSYDKCKDKFKAKSKANYLKNRNYKNVQNMGKTLNSLFDI